MAPAANNAAAAVALPAGSARPERTLSVGTRPFAAASDSVRPGPVSSSSVAPTAPAATAAATPSEPANPRQMRSMASSTVPTSVPVTVEMSRRRGGPKRNRWAIALRSAAASLSSGGGQPP